MKKYLPASLMLALLVIISAFNFSPRQVLKAKEIQQDFVQVTEKLLIAKYEVSNADYKNFVAQQVANNSHLTGIFLLDTAKWSESASNEPLKVYYHSHKSYDNYPVVTVSYEAANEYCKWLTEQYNLDDNRKFKKVRFRLPSEQEWILAASGGNKNKMYPWGKYYLRNKKGEFLCNFLRLGDQSITFDDKSKSYKVVDQLINGPALLPPVNSFYPNESSLYNVSGNAAEMVLEKGLAKGGSFKDPGYDVRISSKKYYQSPSVEIGFRVAMEIIEK